jgi:hypothetical protein
MRKKEQLLWDAWKANAPRDLDLQRVENVVGEGMPDVYVGTNGNWVELKAPSANREKDGQSLLGDAEGLRISQKNWHLKNSSHPNAPRSFILIRLPNHKLFLLSGHLAPVINAMNYSSVEKVALAWTWDGINRAVRVR